MRASAVGRLAVAGLLAAVFVLLTHPTASAHSELESSTPAAGEIVSEAPTEVTLIFSEDIDPQFAQIAVTGEDGDSVTSGEPVIDGARVDQSVRVTSGGAYGISYRIVSADGHPVQGETSFVYAAPPRAPAPAATSGASQPPPVEVAATPSATVAATSTLESAASSGGASFTPLLVIVGILTLALVTLGIRLLVRSR